MYRNTQNFSHPDWHLLNTNMHRVTHWCHTLERWAAIHREHGGTVHSSRAPPPWQGLDSPIFEKRKWESNHQPSSYWTTNSNHWATAAATTKWSVKALCGNHLWSQAHVRFPNICSNSCLKKVYMVGNNAACEYTYLFHHLCYVWNMKNYRLVLQSDHTSLWLPGG